MVLLVDVLITYNSTIHSFSNNSRQLSSFKLITLLLLEADRVFTQKTIKNAQRKFIIFVIFILTHTDIVLPLAIIPYFILLFSCFSLLWLKV